MVAIASNDWIWLQGFKHVAEMFGEGHWPTLERARTHREFVRERATREWLGRVFMMGAYAAHLTAEGL